MIPRILCSVLLVSAAVGCSTRPADVPPGESSPGSPASVWTTGGGPATPGVPAMGDVQVADGGADGRESDDRR
jgi:hypothetical protein